MKEKDMIFLFMNNTYLFLIANDNDAACICIDTIMRLVEMILKCL